MPPLLDTTLSLTLPIVAIHREAFVQRGGWGALVFALFEWNVCIMASYICNGIRKSKEPCTQNTTIALDHHFRYAFLCSVQEFCLHVHLAPWRALVYFELSQIQLQSMFVLWELLCSKGWGNRTRIVSFVLLRLAVMLSLNCAPCIVCRSYMY